MVNVRVSRIGHEVAMDSDQQVGVTREDAQAMFEWAQPVTTIPVRVSRIGVEIALSQIPKAAVTREDAQAMLGWGQPVAAQPIRVSRIGWEAAIDSPRRAAVTREDAQAMLGWGQGAPGSNLRVTRLGIEVAARTSFGQVVPLPIDPSLDFFLHNWAESLVIENSYQTSVSVSKATGAESRRALSAKPFRSMRYEWLLEGRAAIDRFFVQMRKLANRRISLPLYCDQTEVEQAVSSGNDTVLCNTRRRRFFTGQRVAVVQLNSLREVTAFQFLEIESKTNDSLTFTTNLTINLKRSDIVLPMVDVQVSLAPEFRYIIRSPRTGRFIAQAALEVHEVPGASQLPPLRQDLPPGFPTFEGRPIFNIEPDWSKGVRYGYDRQGKVFQLGRADVYDLDAERARRTAEYNLAFDREGAWSFLEFFDTRVGRARSFWMIDQDSPWELDSITTNFVSVDILGEFSEFTQEFDYIGIRLLDGTEIVREVVSIQQIATTWRITVATPLPVIALADVSRIGRARLTRFDKDVLVETWLHTNAMTSTIGFIETLEEKDVPL